MASGRWLVARTVSQSLREPELKPKTEGPRPKAQGPRRRELRFRAVPTLPEEAAPLVGRVKFFFAFLPYLRFPRTLVQAHGGDMPRGMAGARHVTRGPIPRGPKMEWAIGLPMTLDRRAASLGGIAGVSARSDRTGANDGLYCPSGSRKPRLVKQQRAVARNSKPGRLPMAAVRLSERVYTTRAGPIASGISGEPRADRHRRSSQGRGRDSNCQQLAEI